MGFLTRSGPAMRNQYAKKRRRSLPLLAAGLGLLAAAACAVSVQEERSLGVGLGYIVLGREPGAAESQALNVVAAAAFARFSREDERAADHAGVRYTTAAGIDPHGLADMFRILQQVQGKDPGAIEQFFASHPMTADRIADVERTIAADPAARAAAQTGRKDATVFHDLQRAVHALPAAPPKPRSGP